jgi:hypothetical protein
MTHRAACIPDPAAMQKKSGKKPARKTPKGCSSGSAPKKARAAGRTPSKCNPEHEEEEEEICNVFTHEMDNLECDICFQPFETQVYSVSYPKNSRNVFFLRHRLINHSANDTMF